MRPETTSPARKGEQLDLLLRLQARTIHHALHNNTCQSLTGISLLFENLISDESANRRNDDDARMIGSFLNSTLVHIRSLLAYLALFINDGEHVHLSELGQHMEHLFNIEFKAGGTAEEILFAPQMRLMLLVLITLAHGSRRRGQGGRLTLRYGQRRQAMGMALIFNDAAAGDKLRDPAGDWHEMMDLLESQGIRIKSLVSRTQTFLFITAPILVDKMEPDHD